MKKYMLALAAQSITLFCVAQVEVKNLLCENLVDPIGIDIVQPQFSWQLVSAKRNTMQSAYEMRMADNISALQKENGSLWSSGKISSGQSVHVSYSGKPLQSAKVYYWQVRVWDNAANTSAWSKPASFQMGLLNVSDWKAKWIQSTEAEDPVERASPLFRKQFEATKKIRSATMFVTAHGLYEAQINGKRVGDAYLTPGWTSYLNRLQYQTYDVTDQLKTGANTIGVTLGNGWYRGHIGFSGQQNFYGKDISLLLQLEIIYADGSSETVVSDESWRSTTGAIRNSDIYNGETIDARNDHTGWSLPGYNDAGWKQVKTASFSNNNLIAEYNEPVRKHETFQPKRILTTPNGDKVIDFGQNLVGWVTIKVKGKAGDKITISHAEVLDKTGNFYIDNLRGAKATDTYILKGEGEETFEPHFTFHGFQFIRIEGYPGEIKPENFTAVALYSDMKKTGSFSTSSTLLNQLQHNIQWGQKGNFLDVPTDCPQRDERLGWTGDAEVFSSTAAYEMQVNNFFSKWLKDVAADQQPNGMVPHVIPNVLSATSGGSAGWADVATIVPWNMYIAFGDKRILEQQYASMKAWVGFMQSKSTNDLWNTGSHFGDWLFYRPEDDNDGRSAITDKYLIAQCFYAHSTQLVINAAEVLGKTEDVASYTKLLQRIKDAFLKEYTTENGRLISSTQTAYVLALNFDMLPEALRPQAVERLVKNIHDYRDHLTTGFLGTPYLCHVLTRFGYTDVAFKLLMQETYPSWLYPVKQGATTIWERWDGQKPDGSFQTPGMNSFNHYAYGAIGDWMYKVIAGIDTYESDPGYKKIKIAPHVGGGLTEANADLQTYYGLVSSHWKMVNGQLQLDVEIPANTKAMIYLPGGQVASAKESGKELSGSGLNFQIGNNDIAIEVGSGQYHFTVN